MRHLFAALAFAMVLGGSVEAQAEKRSFHHCQQLRRLRHRPLPLDRRELRGRGRDRLLSGARVHPGGVLPPGRSRRDHRRRADHQRVGGPQRVRRHRVPPLATARPAMAGSAVRVYDRAHRRCTACHLRPSSRRARRLNGSAQRQGRCMSTVNSESIRDNAQQDAPTGALGLQIEARRVPAPSPQRALQPGVAGADQRLRAIRYWNTGMAGAGDAGRERRHDRQGGGRPHPHAQDQGLPRRRPVGAAQADLPPGQPRRHARIVSVADGRRPHDL